jgi:hypothetical protein
MSSTIQHRIEPHDLRALLLAHLDHQPPIRLPLFPLAPSLVGDEPLA